MINIPATGRKRVVIVGCGFGGLTLAKKLKGSPFQVVIIDKHNYHQFQPLFYQIASAGLDADSITFPIRKVFQKYNDFYIRKAEVTEVNVPDNQLITSIGKLDYDYLVLAHGAAKPVRYSICPYQDQALYPSNPCPDLKSAFIFKRI